MKVKCLCSINSGEHNTGDVIDLPEEEAKALIKAGAARLTIASDLVQKVKEAVKKASPTKQTDKKGEVKSTRFKLPVTIVVCTAFCDKYKAYYFEKYLKSGSGRTFSNRHF